VPLNNQPTNQPTNQRLLGCRAVVIGDEQGGRQGHKIWHKSNVKNKIVLHVAEK